MVHRKVNDMQLTKIEINGFKSFAKKQELSFPMGITAIVGPNGCGKSNIADAFRFVLGEQSAKALRGKKVEDFIFGGTQKRRALSFCEVSLDFDNSDGKLLTPYSDVCITRRAFRSGESEYLINKASCRLKDIHELFRDTGIGKDGYSIIGQGKVADILSDKGTDRRTAFEEAAGVMKYRSRKDEAEKKLQSTQKNIVRLDDILSELEQRIEPLRTQSEKALSYFKLREELRDIDVNLFIYQYERSNERVVQLTDNIGQLTESIKESELTEKTIAGALTEDEENERRLSTAISEASQRLLSTTTEVESRAGEEKVLCERIASLEKESERLTASIADSDEKCSKLCLNAEQIRASAAEAARIASTVGEELSAAEEKLSACNAAIEAKEDELEHNKQSMMDAMNKLSDAKSRVSRLDEMKKSLLRRIDTIAAESEEVNQEGAKLEQEQHEYKSNLALINIEHDKHSSKRDAAINTVNKVNQELFANKQNERHLENERESLLSRQKVLTDLQSAHEGYYSSVKDLLRDADRDRSIGSIIEGVVAELITVPKEYESAIEMALGSALQNVIVPTEQDAKQVIEYLRKKNYGRATMLPISAMRSRTLPAEERSYTNVEGCYGVASDLVSFSPRYRGVIENLLGRVVIVRDIDVGIAINRNAHSSFRIATLKGDILNQGGSMTGGSMQKREFSLLGRGRELDELSSKIDSVKSSLADITTSTAKLTTKLEDASGVVDEISSVLRKLELQRASYVEKSDIVVKYIDKNHSHIERLSTELSQINDNIADIDAQINEASAMEHGLDTGSVSSGKDIRRIQSELHDMRDEYSRLNETFTALKVKQMANTKESAALENELSRVLKEAAAYRAEKAASASKRIEAENEMNSLSIKRTGMTDSIGADRHVVDMMTDEVRRLEAERAEKLKHIDEQRLRRDNCTAELDDMRERRHRAELTLSRLQIELDTLSQRIWNDYELTYENTVAFRRPIAVNVSHLRMDELRTEIRGLGEVNTASIEDYRNVTERHAELDRQLNDLKQAEADLTEIIKRLTSTMQREFAEQFKLIRENFEQTFSELFLGGKAELRLSDPDDILNCDIEIIAQPPGKKLQLLSLLSGGEQALTAIALLFAILKLKPTAFCILDEIDTSLDEANVDNFAEYLREYSKDTQFIVITHRKGCMAVCNSIYGVSMEEKGVSMLVSARFNDDDAAETA